MGRPTGIRRPRRWNEPGGRARKLPVPTDTSPGLRRPRRDGVSRGAAGPIPPPLAPFFEKASAPFPKFVTRLSTSYTNFGNKGALATL